METLLLEWPNWPVVLQILETFLSTPFSAYSLSHLHIPFLIFIFPSSSSYSLSHLHIPFLICIFPFSSANSLSYLHIPFLRLNCKICKIYSLHSHLLVRKVTRDRNSNSHNTRCAIHCNSSNSTQLTQFNATNVSCAEYTTCAIQRISHKKRKFPVLPLDL